MQPLMIVTRRIVVACLMGAIASVISPYLPFNDYRASAQTPPSPQNSPQPEPAKPQPASSQPDQTEKTLTTFKPVTYRPPQAKFSGRPIAGAFEPRTGFGGIRNRDQRRNCKNDMLLTPGNHVGSTIAPHPTFFWYQATAQPARFVLMPAKGTKPIYETTVPVTKAGIVSVTVPESAPELTMGEPYSWYVTVACLECVPRDPCMRSRIQRVKPASRLLNALAKTAPGEHPALYGDQGIWYDTLTSLVALRRAYPTDGRLTQAWIEVLKSGGLAGVAEQPLVEPPLAPVSRPQTAPAGVRSPELRVPGSPTFNF